MTGVVYPIVASEAENESLSGTAVRMARLLAEVVAEAGLSQRQFANLVGASPKHVNLVFNGKVSALSATLDEWAATLGVRFIVELEEA